MGTGKRIALFRKSKGLTQEELASRLGASRSYLAGIESGKKEPSRNLLMLLIETTDISPDWLLTGQGVMIRDQKSLSIDEIQKELVKRWLDDFWTHSNQEDKYWLIGQIKRTFPEYREWLQKQKNEGGNQRHHTGNGLEAG